MERRRGHLSNKEGERGGRVGERGLVEVKGGGGGSREALREL